MKILGGGKLKDVAVDAHIRSYCWSGDLIRSAFSSGDSRFPYVHSNELVFELQKARAAESDLVAGEDLIEGIKKCFIKMNFVYVVVMIDWYTEMLAWWLLSFTVSGYVVFKFYSFKSFTCIRAVGAGRQRRRYKKLINNRSSWSLCCMSLSDGTSQVEESVDKAYISLIEKAEHFIYIEHYQQHAVKTLS
ncbi:unnamed protein product [Lactuca saligna]|uniref:Uncharacterized protein n=1 Tax=Lactuca saligna TaxID=75948 RepID=A0AA35Y926_LACSI|nr:unnamed protein product [Lactuca saligna]